MIRIHSGISIWVMRVWVRVRVRSNGRARDRATTMVRFKGCVLQGLCASRVVCFKGCVPWLGSRVGVRVRVRIRFKGCVRESQGLCA